MKKILFLLFIFNFTYSFWVVSIENETDLVNHLVNRLTCNYFPVSDHEIDSLIEYAKKESVRLNLNAQNVLQLCLSRIDNKIKTYKKTFLIGVPVAGLLAVGSIYTFWKICKNGDLREDNIKKQLAQLGATNIRIKETRENFPGGLFSDGYTIIRKVASAKSPSLSLNSKVYSLLDKLVRAHEFTLFENVGSFLSVGTFIGSLTFYRSVYDWYFQYKNLWIVKERLQWHSIKK